jgi:hypothetical protein
VADRPIGIGRLWSSGTSTGRPWAKADRDAERAAGSIRCAVRQERKSRPWAASGHGPIQFFLFFLLQYTVLLFFVQILSKFHIVFSIQIFPTKILFREFKSYRNFSIKFKVNEFLFMFPLQIVK